MAENKQNILFSLDIAEKIFSYLSVNDLRQAAGVCRYWHELVGKELHRSTIESLVLPIYSSTTGMVRHVCCGVFGNSEPESVQQSPFLKTCRDIVPNIANWHLSEAVRSVPHILIVFSDYFDDSDNCFCCKYMTMLPKLALYAGFIFLRITVDGTELYGETNLGSGISIPWTANINCEMFNATDKEYIDDAVGMMAYINVHGPIPCPLEDILRELKMNDRDEHNCFLIFLNRDDYRNLRNMSIWEYDGYVAEFLKILKERFKPGTYSVFGTGCRVISTALNEEPLSEINFTYFLRIHGSALKSWSIVISLDLSEEEIKTKLLNLKKEISVNWSTIALCAVPCYKKILFGGTEHGIVKLLDPSVMFKEVFPSVTLTCLYDYKDYFQFGCNTLDNDSDPTFKHKNSMIFLLITTK